MGEDVLLMTKKKTVVNIYSKVAESIPTATHSKTQLDHPQFTDNKIKCVHLFK